MSRLGEPTCCRCRPTSYTGLKGSARSTSQMPQRSSPSRLAVVRSADCDQGQFRHRWHVDLASPPIWAIEEQASDAKWMGRLGTKLRSGIEQISADLHFFGSSEQRAPGTLSFGFPGISGDRLVALVESEIAISTGAACSSGSGAVSHVLTALGCTHAQASTGVRVGLGRFTTEADIGIALGAIRRALEVAGRRSDERVQLKRAIIEEMKAKQMRKAVRKLRIPVVSYRERESLARGLVQSRRATVDALIVFLSEKDVKRLCERRGIDAKGRRRELVARLQESGGGEPAAGVAGSRRGRESGRRGRKRARKRVPSSAPDLQFGTSTDRAGFTPAGIAAFSDLRPAAVVRELIQNSLDAALIEAGETTARVRFERATCKLGDIPGIDSYRLAFRRALEEQSPSGSARAVVQRIERTLHQDSHDLLYVTDNGVGLDGKRMSALLSDGVSAKGGNASGTFGNGHSVVIPASNLRYVLYGGVTEDGRRFGAGQAVLASHRVEGELFGCSGRGVYLESFKRSGPDVPFTLAQDDAVPPMIADAIERIHEENGHGAAIVIPAFNNFEHDQSLREAVFRAASFNFFQAIHEGLLVVEVEDSAGGGVLDHSTLLDALSPYRDEIRSRRSWCIPLRPQGERGI